MLREQYIAFLKSQRIRKTVAECRQERQRSAQKSHTAADRPAAGKSADRLVHNALEDGGCHILAACSFIKQRLHITLGKYPAA